MRSVALRQPETLRFEGPPASTTRRLAPAALSRSGSLVSGRIESLVRARPLLGREDREGVAVGPALRDHGLHQLIVVRFARRGLRAVPMRLVAHRHVEILEILYLLLTEAKSCGFGGEALDELAVTQSFPKLTRGVGEGGGLEMPLNLW